MRHGRKIYVLAEGRLINLSAAEGHPLGDGMSFRIRRWVEYMIKNTPRSKRRFTPFPRVSIRASRG
jgi:S-adenosylhomocysteine hydrolase